MYKRWEKAVVAASAVLAAGVGLTVPSQAMHIMEGYLQPIWAAGWGILSFPLVMASLIRVRKGLSNDRQWATDLLISMAFALILSSLKVPSVTGSSSHLTGIGLGTVLLGPVPMTAVSLIILLYQALTAAHGGLTTLGANVFAMGVAGPWVTWLLFKGIQRVSGSRTLSIFAAVLAGNLAAYAVTAYQLALAHPTGGSVLTSLLVFLKLFAGTQLSLGVVEGLLTLGALHWMSVSLGGQSSILNTGKVQKGQQPYSLS